MKKIYILALAIIATTVIVSCGSTETELMEVPTTLIDSASMDSTMNAVGTIDSVK
jgi:signal peptidase I